MATTGFWPVKSRLKEVIDYANNPDKTTDKRYLDEDLYATLRYVENDKKTDQTMYVSAVNCPKQRAYQCMMTTNSVTESLVATSLIMVSKVSRPVRSLLMKHIKSELKQQSVCGKITRLLLLPT